MLWVGILSEHMKLQEIVYLVTWQLNWFLHSFPSRITSCCS